MATMESFLKAFALGQPAQLFSSVFPIHYESEHTFFVCNLESMFNVYQVNVNWKMFRKTDHEI